MSVCPAQRTREVPSDAAGVPLADYAGYPRLAAALTLPVGAELVAQLDSIDTGSLDAGGQIRLAQQWARVEAAASGRKLRAVAAMAGPEPTVDQLAADRGLPDFTDHEVGAALRLGGTSAQRLTTAARTLAGQMPGALATLCAGDMGYLHALQYAEATEHLTAEQCARVEELTLDKATTKTPWQLRQLLRRTVVRVGAEDFGRRHERQKATVGLSTFFDDATGMGEISARMAAVDAKIVASAAEAWARAAKASGDPRNLNELGAAALVDLAERYLRDPNGPRSYGRPV